MAVRIVTDSTSDIGVSTAGEMGITVLPQTVHFGTRTYEDNVTITPDQFYSKLATEQSCPRFRRPRLGASGTCTTSGTGGQWDRIYPPFILAQRHVQFGLPGHGDDFRDLFVGGNRLCSGFNGLGLMPIVAAAAANRGAGHEEVVAAARDAAARSRCFTLLETLEYLHRGGRIGKAQALLGSILKVKPMTIMRDGEVHPPVKARTFSKALERMKETVRDFAPLQSPVVMHGATPDIASEVSDDLRDLLFEGEEPHIARLGLTLGAYTGPDLVRPLGPIQGPTWFDPWGLYRARGNWDCDTAIG